MPDPGTPNPTPPNPRKPEQPGKPARRGGFQAPKGTRDFYPQEMLRRRYITDAWRRVSLRHGFDEIDGPTFEHLSLYTVKSGEGIVSELFSFQRAGGDDVYALRPEFTPTLARMYAARARQLPQPTKWFCIPNFFRAEKPQRGRLREFFQWNVDVVGGEDAAAADTEVIECSLAAVSDVGLHSGDVKARLNHRDIVCQSLTMSDVPKERHDHALRVLDKTPQPWNDLTIPLDENTAAGTPLIGFSGLVELIDIAYEKGVLDPEITTERTTKLGDRLISQHEKSDRLDLMPLKAVMDRLRNASLTEWVRADFSIVRGLAYYTGIVFEVIAEGERAVAGGGRYDNLIELFGGPPTPACGFGMGDVVLGNLLEDRGLIPAGRELLEAVSRPMPMRPDAFVISSDKPGADEAVTPLVAGLRRGRDAEAYLQSQASDDAAKRIKPWDPRRYAAGDGGVPPLHARRSYKATKNVGKLLADAAACHARFAVIVESPERCTLKDLDSGAQTPDVPLTDVGRLLSR